MNWIILFGLFCILNPFPNFLPAYDELKMVGLPVLTALTWYQLRPQLKWPDFLMIIFLIFCLLSIFQTSIISMVWQPLFNWICVIFLAIGLRPMLKEHLLPIVHACFFLYTFHIWVGVEWLVNHTWNDFWVDYAGQNVNFCSVFPIVLGIPFLFTSYKSIGYNALQIGMLAILFRISLFHQSGLGLGLLTLLTPLFILSKIPGKYRLPIVAAATVGIFIFTPTEILYYPIQKVLHFANEVDDRLYEVRLSWLSVIHHPILGTGIGNWYNDVYEYLPLMEGKNLPTHHVRSHFFLLRILTEIGWPGFLAFLSAFGYAIWKKKNLWDPMVIGIIFIFGTFFTLRPVESNEQNFSEFPLLLLLYYAYLTKDLPDARKVSPTGIFALMIPAFLWFSFWFYANHHYLRSIVFENQGNLPKAISSLERIYHPVFRTVVGQDMYPIDQLLASKYAQLDNREKALFHYERGVQMAPYHSNFVLFYANYLQATEPEKADSIRQEVLQHHKHF